MAAVTQGVGEVVEGIVDRGSAVVEDVSHPVTVDKKAERGERTRFFGYLIGERSSSGLTLIKACAAECLGTGLFVFLATGVVTSGCHTSDVASQSGNGGDTSLTNVATGSCFLSNTSTLLNIALAFGFCLFVIVYFTASFSGLYWLLYNRLLILTGGHINPAVSLGMFLTRRISLLRFVLYVCFQCGGAAIGSIVLKGLDPSGFKAAAGAANQVNKSTGTTVGTALGFEIILTFALVFTVFAATDSERALSTAPLPILAPFSVGMIVFICHLVAIPVDGTSINPARSFGPAVVARQFKYFWIFWVGPFTGAAIGAIMYEIAFKSRPSKKSKSRERDHSDIESGIPIASNAQKAVHAGTAGLEEGAFTEEAD